MRSGPPGQAHGLKPLGLEALDMLRIESGLIFAGYEFDDQVDPFEAGIGFTVALDHEEDFIGRAALEERRAHPQRKLVGLELEGNEAAGHGDRGLHRPPADRRGHERHAQPAAEEVDRALPDGGAVRGDRHQGRGGQARRHAEAAARDGRAVPVLRPREEASSFVNGPGRTGVAGLTPDRQRKDGAPPDGTRVGVANLTAMSGRTGDAGLMPPPRPRSEPGEGRARHAEGPGGGRQADAGRAATAEAGRALRQVMGRFATGVTVVTTSGRETIHGMTANGSCRSRSPRRWCWCRSGRCRMAEMLPKTGRYGVSVLATTRSTSPRTSPPSASRRCAPLHLARRACRCSTARSRMSAAAWWTSTPPVITCSGSARSSTSTTSTGEPLLFYTGRFGTLQEIEQDSQ